MPLAAAADVASHNGCIASGRQGNLSAPAPAQTLAGDWMSPNDSLAQLPRDETHRRAARSSAGAIAWHFFSKGHRWACRQNASGGCTPGPEARRAAPRIMGQLQPAGFRLTARQPIRGLARIHKRSPRRHSLTIATSMGSMTGTRTRTPEGDWLSLESQDRQGFAPRALRRQMHDEPLQLSPVPGRRLATRRPPSPTSGQRDPAICRSQGISSPPKRYGQGAFYLPCRS